MFFFLVSIKTQPKLIVRIIDQLTGSMLYSHCTSTTVTLESLEHRLLASHLYSPAAFLLIFRKNKYPPMNRFPLTTWTHETGGNWSPDTWQDKVKFSPSAKVLVPSVLIVASSVKDIKDYFNPKYFLSKLHQNYISVLVTIKIICRLKGMRSVQPHS